MQKIKLNLSFRKLGGLLFALFISFFFINHLVKNKFISVNESNNPILRKDNFYSPGLISAESSNRLKGLIALDFAKDGYYYGPYNYDITSKTCCSYTKPEILDIKVAEGQECVVEPVPEINKKYITRRCIVKNRQAYIRTETRYCRSTQLRLGSARDDIGNTVQYLDWTLGSCTNKWPTWVYGMTEKKSVKAIDEHNAEITTRTIEADLVNDEYIVKDEVCKWNRPKRVCTPPPIPETPQQYCYDADAPLNSYYVEYQNAPTEANWNNFIGKGSGQQNCCQPLIDNDKLRTDYFDSKGNNIYKTYCIDPSPSIVCFNNEYSYESNYEHSDKTKADKDIYSINCCKEPDAKAEMGSSYAELCPDSPKKVCFKDSKFYEGDSYEDDWNNSDKGTAAIKIYKDACCEEPGAESEMGSFYKNYCDPTIIPEPKICDPKLDPISCTQEPDSGYIYEAGEKGITSNNKTCLLNNSNSSTNLFVQNGFVDNKYCRVLCKEDVDLYFPGFGFNPNSTNGFLIKAGQYFTFKPYIDDKVTNEYLPTVNQSRSCIIESFPYALARDLIGDDSLNGAKQSTGYYTRTEDALIAYYKLTLLINRTSNTHLKTEYETQRKIAADSYRVNSARIIAAITQYNQCANWINKYEVEDYPKIEDFSYSEMNTKNEEVKKYLEKIELKSNTLTVSDSKAEYCDETLNSCMDVSVNVPVPTFKQTTLPGNVTGTQQSFVDSFKSTPINLGMFFTKKTETRVDVNYTFDFELYALKPNGLAVDASSPIFKSMDGKYTFNRIGFGLPVNFDTFGGKRYNYQFVVKNLGKKDGNLITFYKQMQQDQTDGNESVYICHYEVANEIICPPSYCPTICADPLNCSGDEGGIEQPVLQAMFRSINNEDINPNDRALGTNWSDEKGQAAKTKIEEAGDEIYAQTPQYSFKLDTNRILEIKRYNDKNTYASFEMICNQESEKCRSEFVSKFASVISDAWIEYDEATKQFANK